MYIVYVVFLPTVVGQIVRSNVDRNGDVTCSSDRFLVASQFPSGNLTCLAPKDIVSKVKFTNVNNPKMVYFPDRHFEKFVLVRNTWISTHFYSGRYGEYLEIRPQYGCLTMIRSIFSSYIFRTFGIDPYSLLIITTTQRTTKRHTAHSSSKQQTIISTTQSTTPQHTVHPSSKQQTITSTTQSTTTRYTTNSVRSSSTTTLTTKTKKHTRSFSTKQPISTHKKHHRDEVLAGVISLVIVMAFIVFYVWLKRRNERSLRVIGHIYENDTTPDCVLDETNF